MRWEVAGFEEEGFAGGMGEALAGGVAVFEGEVFGFGEGEGFEGEDEGDGGVGGNGIGDGEVEGSYGVGLGGGLFELVTVLFGAVEDGWMDREGPVVGGPEGEPEKIVFYVDAGEG